MEPLSFTIFERHPFIKQRYYGPLCTGARERSDGRGYSIWLERHQVKEPKKPHTVASYQSKDRNMETSRNVFATWKPRSASIRSFFTWWANFMELLGG